MTGGSPFKVIVDQCEDLYNNMDTHLTFNFENRFHMIKVTGQMSRLVCVLFVRKPPKTGQSFSR